MAVDATRLANALKPVLKQGLEDAIEAAFDIEDAAILADFCQAFADGTAPGIADKVLEEITVNARVKPGNLAVDVTTITANITTGAITGTGTLVGTGRGEIE